MLHLHSFRQLVDAEGTALQEGGRTSPQTDETVPWPMVTWPDLTGQQATSCPLDELLNDRIVFGAPEWLKAIWPARTHLA